MTKLIFLDVDDTLLSPPYQAVKRVGRWIGKVFPPEEEFLNRSHIEFHLAFPELFPSRMDMWKLVLASLPFGYFSSQKPLKYDLKAMAMALADDRVILLSKNPPSFTRWRIKRLMDIFAVNVGDRYIACGPMFAKGKSKIEIIEELAKQREVELSDCLLIDDSCENLKAALAAGVDAVLVDSTWNRGSEDRVTSDGKAIAVTSTEAMVDLMQARLGAFRQLQPRVMYVVPPLNPPTILKLGIFFTKRRWLFAAPWPRLSQLVPVARSKWTALFYFDPHAVFIQRITAFLTAKEAPKAIAVVALDGSAQLLAPASIQPDACQMEGDHAYRKVREVSRDLMERAGHRFMFPAMFHFEAKSVAAETARILASERLVTAAQRHSVTHSVAYEDAIKLAAQHAATIITSRTFAGCLMTRVIFDVCFARIFASIHVDFPESLRKVEQDTFVIYASIHRSYLDSAVLVAVLARHSNFFPYVIAADKMRKVWIGKLGAMTGAVFIQRKFVDEMYSAIVSEFLSHVQRQGGSLEVFLEGQRSRTGLTLPPKRGIASIVWDNVNQPGIRRVVVVPISFAYNKLPESEILLLETLAERLKGGASSLREKADMLVRKGRRKTFLARLRATRRRLFSKRVSECHINFGEPIAFARPASSSEAESKELLRLVLNDVMFRINAVTTVLPSSVLCLSVLAASEHHQAVAEAEQFMTLADGILCLYGMDAEQNKMRRADVAANIREFKQLPFVNRKFKRISLDSQDILALSDLDVDRSSYYRNNILHFFVLPALIANVVNEAKMGRIEELHRFLDHMFHKLAAKYFLPMPGGSAQFIDNTLALLVRLELIEFRQRTFAVNSEAKATSSLTLLASIGKQLADGDLFEIFDSFRRVVDRIDVNLQATVHLLSRKVPMEGVILNVSPGGMFLKCAHAFELGDEVHLTSEDDDFPHVGRVVRVDADGVGLATISVVKAHLLDPSEAEPRDPDRRSVGRSSLSKKVLVTFQRKVDYLGVVRNISGTGAFIAIDAKVRDSDMLSISIKGERSSFAANVSVSRITPGGLGVRFSDMGSQDQAKLVLFLDGEITGGRKHVSKDQLVYKAAS